MLRGVSPPVTRLGLWHWRAKCQVLRQPTPGTPTKNTQVLHSFWWLVTSRDGTWCHVVSRDVTCFCPCHVTSLGTWHSTATGPGESPGGSRPLTYQITLILISIIARAPRLAPQADQLDAGTYPSNTGYRVGQMDLDVGYIQAPVLPPGGTGDENPERASGEGILPLRRSI